MPLPTFSGIAPISVERPPTHGAGTIRSSQPTTIRRRLMTDLVVLLAFTGAVILIATWITGAQTVEKLSTSLIERTSLQTEGQLQVFFGALRKTVLIGQKWAARGILDATDYEAMNNLFVPILEQHPQVSSMMVANSDGAEYLLLRDPLHPDIWTNRVVQADVWGNRVFDRAWK